MPKKKSHSNWTQSLSNSLVSLLYFSSAVYGLKNRKSDLDAIAHEQIHETIVVQNSNLLSDDIHYTPDNLMAGARLMLQSGEESGYALAIETLKAYDKLFVKEEIVEEDESIYVEVPETGEFLTLVTQKNPQVHIYESLVYLTALRFAKGMDRYFQDEDLDEYLALIDLQKIEGLFIQIQEILEPTLDDQLSRRMANTLILMYCAVYAGHLNRFIQQPSNQTHLMKLNELDAHMVRFFEPDQEDQLPNIFNNMKAIIEFFLNKKNKLEPENGEMYFADENSMFLIRYSTVHFASLLLALIAFGYQRYVTLPYVFAQLKNINDPDLLLRYTSLLFPSDIRKAARRRYEELLADRNNNQTDLHHLEVKKPLNSKQRKSLNRSDKSKKEAVEVKPVDYGVYVPSGFEETKPHKPEKIHPDKLSKAQEKDFEDTLRRLFGQHQEVFKSWSLRDLRIRLADPTEFFHIGFDQINKCKLVTEILRITGVKKDNPKLAEEILEQYQAQDPFALDCMPVKNNNDSNAKTSLSSLKPGNHTQKVMLNGYPAKQKAVVLIQNNQNSVKRLLELKHAVLKRAQEIHAQRQKNPGMISQEVYHQVSVIRHGAIHLDFKHERISDAARIAFYQDTLNKLNGADLHQAQFNTAHEVYQSFDSDAVVWKNDHARHMESDFKKCMDMIEARFLMLYDPQIQASAAASEMLTVEIGEIYSQLRNAKVFNQELDNDYRSGPAIKARNEFAHQGYESSASVRLKY